MRHCVRIHVAGLAVAGLFACCTAASAATVTGTVTYDGKVPNLKPLAMDADPVCAGKHKEPVPNEMLKLGASGNTMGNILVHVVSGLPEGKTFPPPKDPVVMDQNGCLYHPHVFVVAVGQSLKVLNSDGILHNVHALPNVNPQFNMAMPPTRTEAEHVFDKPEGPFQIKCDVHPWMTAYVLVTNNPFYSVTGDDGKFTLANLPAGTYEIEAWHEKLGKKTATVTVAEGDTKSADFTFSAPAASK
ncbi:MAG TPA: carboxypeptidase regulatory-like domain-containing protein [Candidatus Dormibacteraeota bacterium]|nr:carboxypeptidase regulatory-like domain-containing protein [Candidatus Dormibacteraeota bacterium]